MFSSIPFFNNPFSISFRPHLPILLALLLGVCLASGCSSGMSATMPPVNTPTNVVVMMTSTANDQLVQFFITIASISLGDKANNTVTLYTNPNLQDGKTGNTEFMHLNGVSEPVVTAMVPKGVYTQAIVVVTSCSFTNVTVGPTGGVVEATFAQGLCGQGTGQTTVNLPAPITISGSTMALSLNLQVAKSFTLNPAAPPPNYTISPVFTLTPLTLSAQPTNELNGKFSGINARITSINASANNFMAQTADGFSLTVNSGAGTAFQGVASFSTLAVGTLVNIDVAIQPDASLLATRVEVDDLAAPTTSIGPLIVPGSVPAQFVVLPTLTEGCTLGVVGTPFCGSIFDYDSNTAFGVSGQFNNVQSLPFPATFNGPGLLLGQNISLFSSGQLMGQGFELVTTAKLSPQVVNGRITAVSSNNSFTVYSVALAPDSLVPTLQSIAGQINRLNNPTTSMEVYVDSSTQLLNTSPITTGSLLRFRGLVFDDNGTLRMDCGQVIDGVAE
jgi:hypothetical protein